MSGIVKMITLLIAVLSACVAGVATSWVLHANNRPTASMPDEREAIRATLTEQDAAWNVGDLDRFMQTYWADDGLTFYSGGDVMKGHKAVHERYKKRYQAEGKEMGKLTFSDLEVTMLSAEWAQARGRWKVEMKKETVEGLFTLVLRKTASGWKIVHDHTSRAEKG